MKINDIIIRKYRIRKDIGDLKPLKVSLQKYGLLSPIIINSKNILIAGERRLQAAKELGWDEIDVIIKDIKESQAFAIELDENITRKDFSPSELTEGLQKQHELNNHNIFYKIFYAMRDFFHSLFK